MTRPHPVTATLTLDQKETHDSRRIFSCYGRSDRGYEMSPRRLCYKAVERKCAARTHTRALSHTCPSGHPAVTRGQTKVSARASTWAAAFLTKTSRETMSPTT